MFNIMRADVYRILRGKGIYICLMLVLITVGSSIYAKFGGTMGLNLDVNGAPVEEVVNIENMDDFFALMEAQEVDVDIMSVGGNLYYFFIFVVFAVFCVDLSNRTARNVISSGVPRNTYYLSKLILSLLIGTFFIVLHTYTAYFGNLLYNGSAYGTSFGTITIIMLRQLPMFYGIISILVMLSALLQKASKYIAVTALLLMVVQLVLISLSSIFSWDLNTLLLYTFEGIIGSMAVIGAIPTDVLIRGIAVGVTMVIVSTIVGMGYFKKCTIK